MQTAGNVDFRVDFPGEKGSKVAYLSSNASFLCTSSSGARPMCYTGENTKKSSASAQWNRRLEAGKRPFFVIKSRNFVRWRVVKLLRFWTFLIFSIPKNYAPPSSQNSSVYFFVSFFSKNKQFQYLVFRVETGRFFSKTNIFCLFFLSRLSRNQNHLHLF